MAMKFKYAKREEIPAEHAAFYVERDGAFVLDVAGAVDKAALDEFRSTNAGLNKALAEFKAKYAGIDPEAVKQLAEEKARLEEEQKLKEGKLSDVIAERIRAAVGPLQAERDAAQARLAALLIDQAVVAEATRRGLRATAVPDLTLRARAAVRLVDGAAQVFDGEKLRVGKDGVTPMSVAEWVESLGAEAPHLFEANAGGGAAGSGSGGASGNGGVVNPFAKASYNLTEQMRLLRENPGLAARLEAAAGSA